ncbi:hypothetical protein ISCGN_007166 [Ixodes scapularis]
MIDHSPLYTRKAWQFDDGVIECPIAEFEREDLVAQSISHGVRSQRTDFAAATTRNMGFKPGEKRSGSPRNASSTSGHCIARVKCVLASRRSGAPRYFPLL